MEYTKQLELMNYNYYYDSKVLINTKFTFYLVEDIIGTSFNKMQTQTA